MRPWAAPGTILGLTLVLAGVAARLPPIPQDPGYHRFADARAALGVPNVLDVASNLPLVVVGIAGLALVFRSGTRLLADRLERWAWTGFFSGVGLAAIGSAYYHLAPDNPRLLWDRLPMTLAFTSLLAAVVGERVCARLGAGILAPLVALGVASVTYWHVTETAGRGDLRAYAFVQLYPMAALPLLLAFYPPRYTRGCDLVTALGLYVAAKAAELLDAEIFARSGVVSGHTLKHLLAAAAGAWLLIMVVRRRPVLPAGRGPCATM